MEPGMTYSRGVWAALALGTLLVVGAGCAGSATKSVTGIDSPVVQKEVTEQMLPKEGDVIESETDKDIREIKLIARRWEFEPSEVRVNLGETVRFTITNKDVDHGFAIPTLGVNQIIGAGETVSVEFTADKAGKHTFFCTVFCGSGHGNMRGILIVE